MNKKIIVDGVEYVAATKTAKKGSKPVVLIRSDKAGVFVGALESRDGDTVTLSDSRRIWYWDGAASISELALRGVTKPQNCKFPDAVASQIIFGVCEIIPVTEEAAKSIAAVEPWRV